MVLFRQILRAIAFVLWVLVMLPFVYGSYLLKLSALNRFFLKIWFSVAFVAIIGGRVKDCSKRDLPTSFMLASNHTSYLDIFALATVYMPRFTPKSEVAGWPAIGFLCKIAGCFFIERRASGLQKNQQQLAQAIEKNETICLFPEGTTGLGDAVLPFKGGLLEIATEAVAPALSVFPVLVLYTHLNGTPLTPQSRHHLAWIGEGDGDFLSHFWHVLAQKNFAVEIHTLAPAPAEARADRKALAQYCETTIRAAMLARMQELKLEHSPKIEGDAA